MKRFTSIACYIQIDPFNILENKRNFCKNTHVSPLFIVGVADVIGMILSLQTMTFNKKGVTAVLAKFRCCDDVKGVRGYQKN
jgi:hypothetical protein